MCRTSLCLAVALGLGLAVACGTPAPTSPAAQPVGQASVVTPRVDAAAPPAPSPKTAPEISPRRRAAYHMLLSLSSISRWLEQLNPDVVDDGCPTDIAWVTWGIAKTDPWDNPFDMTCNDETGRTPRFRSAGPDGALDTDDDVVGDEPLATADACAPGCAAAFECGGQPEDVADVAACVSVCSAAGYSVQFYVDTCRVLADCASVGDCVSSALGEYQPSGSCQAFGSAAARTFGGDATAVRALEQTCEADLLRAPELVCVEASTTPREASLCHLTVNRSWPRDVAGLN